MAEIKKQAFCDSYKIYVDMEGGVHVEYDGYEVETGKTKSVLREISEKAGFSYEDKWNTRQLGGKLIDFLNDMEKLLEEFMHLKQTNGVDVYNEISLQLELGLYLRQKGGYTVRFERNIGEYVDVDKTSNFVKKEIDIVAYKGKDELKAEKIAIELKFPRNGQYPEQMFSFVEDIKFMEQVKRVDGFKTFVVVLVDDKNFYENNKRQPVPYGIYSYFRSDKKSEKKEVCIPANTIINKPTGKKVQSIGGLNNQYNSTWKQPTATWLDAKQDKEKYRYYIIECQ